MRKKVLFMSVLLTLLMAAGCGKNPDMSAAERIMADMTLEEKVWQMFFVTPEDITGIGVAVQAGDATRRALAECPVGGIVYFGQNIQSRSQLSEMISNTQSYSKIPLFLSVDEEGGRVSRLGGAGIIAKLPAMKEIGDMGEAGTYKASEAGEFLASELSSLGFNMDFAPVADVITDAGNADIGDRSFGTDPNIAAKLVAAETESMQRGGVCAVLKHFPGNGGGTEDTHKGKSVSLRSAEEIRVCEFIPFKSGIDAGAGAVMVSHITVPALAGGDIPSVFSSAVIQDYLRGELGFNKVVITDALNMGAVTDFYTPEEAVLAAINAGADMLLMPQEVKSAAASVIEKVKSGAIEESRIDESVKRILELKEERGILK